ncbi:uncharacterized protein LOC117648385 [Thrips palmi]|uniref:Uncharacterized protein LOC117648385 n=1 Tax=Thrips palmi TaxID=161013 RepID=A0A6P8Z8I3_THRPL|nr:uncharacterized protein LOC117648385 [Thrips palmi]
MVGFSFNRRKGALLAGTQCDYPRGCKEYLRNCLARLPAILDQREMQSIPTDAVELDATCLGFDTGMGCVDNFTANCLGKEREKQKWVENTVAGARATFNILCGSKEVREQYLKHARCFRAMSVTDGWNNCASRFIGLVREEMARPGIGRHEERIMELCCAKHGFLRCVFGSAKHKCGSNSATFLRKVAETLSSVRVEAAVCRYVNHTACSDIAICFSLNLSCIVAK